MAFVYELVVNFGTNDRASRDAAVVCAGWPPVRVRDLDLPLTFPLIGHGSSHEFTVWVPGINFGGFVHPDLDPRTLTGAELCAVRDAFYGLLSKFDGYETAMVGWDPEEDVDEERLRLRLEELGMDGLGGLVLRAPLAVDLGLEALVEPFTEGYVRLPYEEPRVWWI